MIAITHKDEVLHALHAYYNFSTTGYGKIFTTKENDTPRRAVTHKLEYHWLSTYKSPSPAVT